MPYKIVKEENKYCVHKENADGSVGKTVKCHDSESQAKAHMRALYANVKDANMTFYTELTLSNISKPFDGMAIGDFKTSQGAVSIKSDELDQYLQNTKDVLESTRTESGEIVGLPIDMDGHDHKGGAGWIVDVVREGDLLRFIPKWTEAGQKIIREGVRRFFSPSFDAENKVIIGGSMTNYPASRDDMRRLKLRPVELSETMFTAEYDDDGFFTKLTNSFEGFLKKLSEAKPAEEKPKEVSMPTDTLAELAAKATTPEGLAELEAELNKRANTKVVELLEAEQRKNHVSELAETWVGGTKENPKGLPVSKESLVEFMSDLTPEQMKRAEAIFGKIVKEGFIEFEEEGHSQELQGLAALPEWAAPLLRDVLANGGTIKEFFDANTEELGEMKSYNLSEYKDKED